MKLKSLNSIVAFSLLPIMISIGGKDEQIFDDKAEFYKIDNSAVPAYFDYTIKHDSFVKIKVNNLDGTEVYGFVEGEVETGNYHKLWNISKDNKRVSGLFEIDIYEDGKITSSKIIFIPEGISNKSFADYDDLDADDFAEIIAIDKE